MTQMTHEAVDGFILFLVALDHKLANTTAIAIFVEGLPLKTEKNFWFGFGFEAPMKKHF